MDDQKGKRSAPNETGEQWALLDDPAWQPENADRGVLVAAIVGGWLASAGGGLSTFHPNPDYEPFSPGSLTDPVGAALRLAACGAVTNESLFSVIEESNFPAALNDRDTPIVVPSPDDVPLLLVATAPSHQSRVRADHWEHVNAVELADLLLAHEVDVLLNPGARPSIPACRRRVRPQLQGSLT